MESVTRPSKHFALVALCNRSPSTVRSPRRERLGWDFHRREIERRSPTFTSAQSCWARVDGDGSMACVCAFRHPATIALFLQVATTIIFIVSSVVLLSLSVEVIIFKNNSIEIDLMGARHLNFFGLSLSRFLIDGNQIRIAFCTVTSRNWEVRSLPPGRPGTPGCTPIG